MKNLVLLLLLFIATDSYGQWNILATDSINGYEELDFFSISFLNENVGYVGAVRDYRYPNTNEDYYYFKTIDGGLNWTEMMNIQSTGEILFLNEKKGFILGDSLWTTNDSAQTWTKSNVVLNGLKIQFVNDTIGYIMAENQMFKTNDGGDSWTILTGFSGISCKDMYFLEKNSGWAINNEFIYKTNDGGLSWTSFPILRRNYTDLWFTNKDTGHAIGSETYTNGHSSDVRGYIIKTTDGGINWSTTFYDWHAILLSITFTSNDTGYAVGGGTNIHCSLLRTVDGGESWHYQANYPCIGNMNSVLFVNPSIGFVTGFGILKTNNGGGPMDEIPAPKIPMYLFPNPTSKLLNIPINNPDFLIEKEIGFEIFDSSGRMVKYGNSTFFSIIQINVESLASGLYFIRIVSDIESYNLTSKFVVEN